MISLSLQMMVLARDENEPYQSLDDDEKFTTAFQDEEFVYFIAWEKDRESGKITDIHNCFGIAKEFIDEMMIQEIPTLDCYDVTMEITCTDKIDFYSPLIEHGLPDQDANYFAIELTEHVAETLGEQEPAGGQSPTPPTPLNGSFRLECRPIGDTYTAELPGRIIHHEDGHCEQVFWIFTWQIYRCEWNFYDLDGEFVYTLWFSEFPLPAGLPYSILRDVPCDGGGSAQNSITMQETTTFVTIDFVEISTNIFIAVNQKQTTPV